MANIGVNIPDGGSSSIPLLTAIVNLLTGSKRPTKVIESLIDGSTPDNVQSVAILFEGGGGTLAGVGVPDGFVDEWSPNKGDDTVEAIAFTVPITGAVKRVTISYVDL